ncbi:hypothetical protein [Streptomyces bullii]|uniref:Uncharacterized protein n=1 Tax=Streptomyces bullii TaxID=349910 RepID=A0ABW0V477_9ACTN
MPARPERTRPDDAALAAAMSRTLTALAALLQALGDGEHPLNLVAEPTDDTFVRAQADLSVGTAPLRLAVVDEDDYCALCTLLVFALEGSTVRSAVLVATTATEPHPRACGWAVRNGWLHPMDTAELQQAVIPCPGVPAVLRKVYDAPVLSQITDTDEEGPRAEKPAVTDNGYCTNTAPVPGTIHTVNAKNTGAKFFRLHGRRYGECPCGKEVSLTERDMLRRHKPPQE